MRNKRRNRSRTTFLTMPMQSRKDNKSGKPRMRDQISHARQNNTTAYDLAYKLLVDGAKQGLRYIPIRVIHDIRKKNVHCGKPSDSIMFGAIRKFNSDDQSKMGVYVHYRKEEKRIIFTSIDGDTTASGKSTRKGKRQLTTV